MTRTAIYAITKINALERAIKDVERQINECRNNRDYNALNEKLTSLYTKMKIYAELLVSSLTSTIDYQQFKS